MTEKSSLSSPRLTVTGSLAYDHLLTYNTPFKEVLLAEKLDRLSVCFLIDQKERHFGGNAGNIAYSLGLLNEPCTILSAVGWDFEPYCKHLETQNIDFRHVKHYETLETASAIIVTDPEGNQIIQFYPGAMAAEGEIDVQIPFQQASAILIAPDHIRRVLHYVRSARSLKKPYFFDPGQNTPYFKKEQLMEAIEGALGLFVNEYEFEILKQKTGLSEAELQQKTPLIILTLGDQGSMIHNASASPVAIQKVQPHKILDPTGCGDAYRAGFLKGYIEGYPLTTCGQMGALMATYSLEHPGTQNHKLNWEEFNERYEKEFKVSL